MQTILAAVSNDKKDLVTDLSDKLDIQLPAQPKPIKQQENHYEQISAAKKQFEQLEKEYLEQRGRAKRLSESSEQEIAQSLAKKW